jgi:hypothetical protein
MSGYEQSEGFETRTDTFVPTSNYDTSISEIQVRMIEYIQAYEQNMADAPFPIETITGVLEDFLIYMANVDEYDYWKNPHSQE